MNSSDTSLRESRDAEISRLATERCKAENAKWSDPMDICYLRPGECDYCHRLAVETYENNRKDGSSPQIGEDHG